MMESAPGSSPRSSNTLVRSIDRSRVFASFRFLFSIDERIDERIDESIDV